jgi:hypothetical protein
MTKLIDVGVRRRDSVTSTDMLTKKLRMIIVYKRILHENFDLQMEFANYIYADYK